MQNLSEYKKTKDWLVCVDSDGCAMDTMDIKHYKCFGPCMISEWGLEVRQKEILSRWNDINLYTMTRGINRFKGLATALFEIDKQYCKIDGIDRLCDWAQNSDELSNNALEREIAADPTAHIFKKALNWSRAVNESIKQLPESEIKPFDNVIAALEFAHQKADIAIVSSANIDAVLDEWQRHGLLAHTDIVLAQNAGSKAFCIAELLKKGYNAQNVLMCGDAPGDKSAADKNGVLFYPILVRREGDSWAEFIHEGFNRFVNGEYKGEYQSEKNTQFINNLGGNSNG